MIILYCEKCGARVSEKDVASGVAQVNADNHALCGNCAPARRKDSHRAMAPEVGAGKAPSTRLVAAPGKTGVLSARREVAPPRRNLLLIGVGVTGGFVLLFVCLWYGLQGRDTPPKAVATTQKPDPQVPTAGLADSHPVRPTDATLPLSRKPADAAPDNDYNPRAAVAASVLQQAKDGYKRSPHAPWLYRDRLEELTRDYRGTPASIEAEKILRDGSFPPRPPSKGTDRLPDEAEWRKAVEILPSVDPGQDTIRGEWSRKDDLLLSSGFTPWIALPYAPSEEYDLRLVFVRRSSDECFVINLPRLDRSCSFILCARHDWFGFEKVRGKLTYEISGSSFRPGLIQNGKTYVLTIQVRRDALKAWLDGQPLCECRATAQETTASWELANPERLALGSYNSTYEVRSLKILEWAGEGRFLRPPPAKTIPDEVAFGTDTHGAASNGGAAQKPAVPPGSTPAPEPGKKEEYLKPAGK